jgi:putative PIN family toxin of toxin-antitoxin system
MRIERVVLDTNVLISAALSGLGKPFAALVWVRRNATLVASAPLVTEVSTRLARPRLAAFVDPAEAAEFVDALADQAEMVEIPGTLRACRDPDDDMVLETAMSGRANCVVTGDKDLLVLDPFRGIRILTPAAFLEAVQAGSAE